MVIADNYQENVRLRLNNSKIYLQIKTNCEKGNDNGCEALINLIHDAVNYCYERNKMVIKSKNTCKNINKNKFLNI